MSDIKEIKLIGEVPSHIAKEDYLDYLIYTFEFSIRSFRGENVEELREKIIETRDEICPNFEELSEAKQWWVYVLVLQWWLMKEERAHFAVQVIQSLLSSLPHISDEEAEKRMNFLQQAVYFEFDKALIIRPVELKALGNELYREDVRVEAFLKTQESMTKRLSEFLEVDDILEDYLLELSFADKELWNKFSSFWDAFYEVVMNYYLYSYELTVSVSENDLLNDKDAYDYLDDLMYLFTMSIIKDTNKIEETHEIIMDELQEFKGMLAEDRKEFAKVVERMTKGV